MIKCVFKPHTHIWTWFKQEYVYWWGFPCSSAGKESACSAGDPSSVPGLGGSPREGIGYPIQCSWASLVAQKVKNPPAMRETWIQSLGWEDPLEEGMKTHSSIFAWRIAQWQRSLAGYNLSGRKESDMTEQVSTAFQTNRWIFWNKK